MSQNQRHQMNGIDTDHVKQKLYQEIEIRLVFDAPEVLSMLIPILELLRQRVNAAHMKG